MSIFNFLRKPKEKCPITEKEYELPKSDYEPDVYRKNYPRSYPMTSYAYLEDGLIFTRDANDFLLRDIVKRVIFTDTTPPEGNRLVDVSHDQDRSILAWNHTLDHQLCLVVSSCKKGVGISLNRIGNYMFGGFRELESIEWNNIVTTKDTISMKRMFDTCKVMESVDLSCFDMRNVKFLEGMFCACLKLKDIKWFPLHQTGRVEDVSRMFSRCEALRSVNLGEFNTASLRNCKKMFNDSCVRAVNLGPWGPTALGVELNVENMFAKTGLLSILTTDNPVVQKEYLNMDDSTKYCQDKNNFSRSIVPASEWRIPVYPWDKP